MNTEITNFYLFSINEKDGCSLLHRAHCQLVPGLKNRIFMGSFHTPLHAWQYFRIHNPDRRAAFCLSCMKNS